MAAADEDARGHSGDQARSTGYRFPLIAQILDELAAGNPEQIRRALESRPTHLDEVSAGCLAGSAALHGYLLAWGTSAITRPVPPAGMRWPTPA